MIFKTRSEEKLTWLGKYLSAYTKILTRNPKAAAFTTIYVDAFIGTDYRSSPKADNTSLPLFDDDDARAFQKGSAQIALGDDPPFDSYLFIDEVPDHVRELEDLAQ
jgi:three-Cys-motif partner protein